MRSKRHRLEGFLEQRNIQLHHRDRFVRSTSRRNPLVQIDYSLVLDQDHRFDARIFGLVKDYIRRFNLKVYFIMVSWWGRGDRALWTGRHLLKTLQEFQREGLCEVLLSYQAADAGPSGLCTWCRRRGIEILYVDRYRLVSRNGEEVVPKGVPGKAENVIKSIKLIERKTKEGGVSARKTLVIFVDDDYTQYHWVNYFLLFAPWVLSFGKDCGDPALKSVISRIQRVGFIKSGSPRIILPYELQDEIVGGEIKPLDYLGVTLAVLDLASAHPRWRSPGVRSEIEELRRKLKRIQRKKQILTPRNRADILGEALNERLEILWRENIYRGGRVTQQLEGIFRYLSHKSHCRWLRQLTFILHGDQGAPLDAWLKYSPFGGYALEISLLIQAMCDKAFENHQILNILGLPHSHQRSKELAIWRMLDTILLTFDLARVLYKDLPMSHFHSVYGYKRQFPMLDRYGDIIHHCPEYGGLKIYPPLKLLKIE